MADPPDLSKNNLTGEIRRALIVVQKCGAILGRTVRKNSTDAIRARILDVGVSGPECTQ